MVFGLRDILFLCACGAIHLIYRHRRKLPVPLPPGVLGWPIVGNAFQIPLTYPHVFYKDLGQRLGSKILYLEALGKSILVINDLNVAKDLLEKRSGLYSSRPDLPMLTEVAGVREFFLVMPYGDAWRANRRIFQQYFSPKSLHRQQETTLEFVRKGLLPNLYGDPEHFRSHVQSCIGGLSVSTTYGVPVRRTDDPRVMLSDDAFTAMSGAAAPGKYLVNVLPILKYVPEWVPGATFQKVARGIRERADKAKDEPYQHALKYMRNGAAKNSFISESIERLQDAPDSDLHQAYIKDTACQVLGAASETTVTATMSFILAMLKYPEVQRKAQQEVDSVVGSDRLPEFSDQPHLPYLSAVLKEVLRWNPVGPMGVPHATTEDDIYEGYYIPKGCTILTNIYAMLHDEEIFPNPEMFNPDRFIKDGILITDIRDPTVEATFGFGRRICPGSHIALSTLYIIAASILTLFDISPAHDSEGNPIDVRVEFAAASLVSEPLPFQSRFTPRSGKDVGSLLREYLGFDTI